MHWLAGDPNFRASLNDLDRGLLDGRGASAAADEALAPLPVPQVARVSPVSSAPQRHAADERPAASARPPVDSRSPRPLLDLFPSTLFEADGPPMAVGTASGPQPASASL